MKDFSHVLSREGHELLKHFLSNPPPSFYLAGGTGLALQLGHRASVDFDFFSPKVGLNFSERDRIKIFFSSFGINFTVESEKDGTLIVIANSVRNSFFHYPYALLEPVEHVEKLEVASIMDIAAMKLSAIVGRGSRRDFIDLYEICEKINLKTLLEKAAKKYKQVSDFPFLALKALIFFDDAEAEPMPAMLKPADWKQIRSFFEKEAGQLSREWLS